MLKALIATTLLSIFVVACATEADELTNGKGGRHKTGSGSDDADGDGIPDDQEPGTTAEALECKQGIPHPGFANFDFVSDRKPGVIGDNRRRVKPFSAMASEFQRALGAAPANLDQSAAAFGDVPARWYSEPTAGAVSLFTTYNLAFTACYDNNQIQDCAQLQRKIWERTPTPDETTACEDFVNGLAEPDPKRKWAHACASIMSSAGFTTY
jgi:hypothetical protein